MTREQLQRASEARREASAATEDGEARERFYERSNDPAELATAGDDPDGVELDRRERSLAELAEQSRGDVGARVEAALNHVRASREGE